MQSTLEEQIAAACGWMVDSYDLLEILQRAAASQAEPAKVTRCVAQRIVIELKMQGRGRPLEATFAFLTACRARDAVTRLDYLAALVTACRDTSAIPDDPGAMLAECEALLRDLRAACALAGVVTEPPMNDEELFEETLGRR